MCVPRVRPGIVESQKLSRCLVTKCNPFRQYAHPPWSVWDHKIPCHVTPLTTNKKSDLKLQHVIRQTSSPSSQCYLQYCVYYIFTTEEKHYLVLNALSAAISRRWTDLVFMSLNMCEHVGLPGLARDPSSSSFPLPPHRISAALLWAQKAPHGRPIGSNLVTHTHRH